MDMDERLHVEIAFPARGVDADMVARFRVQPADSNVPRIIIFTYNLFLVVHEFLMLFLILLMHFFYLFIRWFKPRRLQEFNDSNTFARRLVDWKK